MKSLQEQAEDAVFDFIVAKLKWSRERIKFLEDPEIPFHLRRNLRQRLDQRIKENLWSGSYCEMHACFHLLHGLTCDCGCPSIYDRIEEGRKRVSSFIRYFIMIWEKNKELILTLSEDEWRIDPKKKLFFCAATKKIKSFSLLRKIETSNDKNRSNFLSSAKLLLHFFSPREREGGLIQYVLKIPLFLA